MLCQEKIRNPIAATASSSAPTPTRIVLTLSQAGMEGLGGGAYGGGLSGPPQPVPVVPVCGLRALAGFS